MKVGLLGAGGIARAHLPGWVELGAEVVIRSTDGNDVKLAEQYAEHGVTAVGSLDELLAACEVVDICTPSYNHQELALAAIAAGKHVVCEKPFALTVEDAEAMAAAAEAAGVQLYPAHVVRYFPAYRALQQAVAGGELGEPAVLRFTRGGGRPVWSSWFADPELSGGVLMDLMIHDMDIARWLAGEVVRVHAQVNGNQDADAGEGDVVSSTVVLTHASGAVSHVTGLWGLPDQPFRTTFRVAGPGGVLTHDSTALTGFNITAQGVRKANDGIPGSPMTESPYLSELREFAAAFVGGPAPRVSTRDGVIAVRIAAAAAESARTGRAVEIAVETEIANETEEVTR